MFLDNKIHYLDIIPLNEACCEAHKANWLANPSLDDIVAADAEARRWVKEQVRRVEECVTYEHVRQVIGVELKRNFVGSRRQCVRSTSIFLFILLKKKSVLGQRTLGVCWA